MPSPGWIQPDFLSFPSINKINKVVLRADRQTFLDIAEKERTKKRWSILGAYPQSMEVNTRKKRLGKK